ncbi:GNAT family N-acetyltransferase [Flavobacterium johnsoniae]|uniref:Protein N-acetyltransferase, RimJ/RimL family n=1 Tax=Flavobacterium johnsoniae TaxID=986 RepID=A0A1M5NSL5_FLAJO|nr:GNAT family protein [Flavobacterium johnsoniae]SHG92189.1 Protein N-acetyltransferase, RimJ/RimL family [Flavobacterium johnsoniae]
MNKASNFSFSDNVILEDDFVLLRPIQESDVENLLEISINEPETWKYSLVGAEGKENLIHYIQLAIKARESQKEFPFIVFDKKSQKYAGSTRFYDINLDFQTLQLGYTWYGSAFRGTGLNKHCKFLLLQFAFETLGMERVEFRADNNNERSIAAMKSIGCKVEGVLRSNMPTRDSNVRRDSIVLSILKNEWFDEVKENLKKKLYRINN